MRGSAICAVALAAALLAAIVNGASQADPSQIVPEVTPILELDAAGSAAGSAADGPIPYTADDVDRTPGYEGTDAPIEGGVDGDLSGDAVRDDPSDAEPGSGEGGAGTDNSAGVNKLTGGGKTSDMGSAGVKSPGYTPEDSWSDKQGHYYLGPSRRRVGAGFGRRRTAPEHEETVHEEQQDHQLIKNLTMGMAGDVPPPPPSAKQQVKKEMAMGEGKDSPDAITPAPTPSPTAGDGCGDVVPGYRRISGPKGPNRCREGSLRIKEDSAGSIEKAAAECDKTHGCMAFNYVDGGQYAGGAGYFTTCNMFNWIEDSGQPVGTQSWDIFESCSKTPKLDFTPCGCYAHIPKAKGCTCKYWAGDVGTCSGCCRGFGYDSSSAPLCTSGEDTILPTPAPTKYQLLVRVTTGTIDYADSNMEPQIVVTGDKGDFTGTFGTGNKKGAVETTTFHPDSDIGTVQKVHINSENGNGWYFTKFEVKSGNNDWVMVGCTDQWLDAAIDSGTYDGKMYGTSADLHPITEHCTQATPESWGAPTKSGCFCKGSGKSGTCALNGDPTPWCRTKDKCLGTASAYGNWDKCTPS